MQKRIEKILELDKKRTSGEWKAVPEKSYNSNAFKLQRSTGELITYLDFYKDSEADADFIAAAPEMLSIIKKLWEEKQIKARQEKLIAELKKETI